jgi:hypothetical protein
VRSRPPSVQPAARPDPSGPSADHSLCNDRYRCHRSCSEEPDGSGVNGLTPGAPATPRPAIAGRPGPAVDDARPPPPLLGSQICRAAAQSRTPVVCQVSHLDSE